MFKLFCLLFFIPLNVYCQQPIYNLPWSPETIGNKEDSLQKLGLLTYRMVDIKNNRGPFRMIKSPYLFNVYVDTVHYTDGSYAVGILISDRNMSFDQRKVGSWTFYYPSGAVRAFGNFSIGAYTVCQSLGPYVHGYSYKSGFWKYWYESGVQMVEGNYRQKMEVINWNCGTDSICVSEITDSWIFFDSTGRKSDHRDLLLKENFIIDEPF